MRLTLISTLLCLLIPAATLAGADAPPAPAATRTQQVHTANVDTNALLQRTSWKGLLFAAPTNAAADVAALLKQEKHQKTGGYLLRTEDPVLFTRMQDLSHAHKTAAVVLDGRLEPNGTTILVTDLSELPKERKPERK